MDGCSAGLALVVYNVNCVKGSFACFSSLFHYCCKWILCEVIKCSSAAEKCRWMEQTEQQVLVVPSGHAKPRSDFEATKEAAPYFIGREEHFIFSVNSVVAKHNELLQACDIAALAKNKIKHCCFTDRLAFTVKMCDFKNAIDFKQTLFENQKLLRVCSWKFLMRPISSKLPHTQGTVNEAGTAPNYFSHFHNNQGQSNKIKIWTPQCAHKWWQPTTVTVFCLAQATGSRMANIHSNSTACER